MLSETKDLEWSRLRAKRSFSPPSACAGCVRRPQRDGFEVRQRGRGAWGEIASQVEVTG